MSEVQATETKRTPKLNLEAAKNEDNGQVTVTAKFPDGHTEAFSFDNQHALYEHFAVHGVGKKIRDTVATIKEPADQKAAVQKLFTAFNEGKWNAIRSGDGSPQVGVLARALSALYGKSLEDAQEFVKKLNKKQQSDMRHLPAVAAKITELNAEKTSEDAKNLLADFAAME